MLITAITSRNTVVILMSLLASAFVIFCAMPIHEFSHGYAAYKMGDDTAKRAGRLTLNPMAHISPVGAVMLVLFGFGWGNPCPINPNRFKHPKTGIAVSAFAGPLSNLILGFFMVLFMTLVENLASTDSTFFIALYYFFYIAAQINIILAVFNLLPIPPLDGYRVLSVFLPDKAYYWVQKNEQIISIVIIVLVFTGLLTKPLSYLTDWILYGFHYVCSLPF